MFVRGERVAERRYLVCGKPTTNSEFCRPLALTLPAPMGSICDPD
jgi:hypothetical protein